MQNTKIFGHPKGLFLVSGVELWERFSYYGMLGLLVLYLTATADSGGFQWSTVYALKLMGIYTGLVFASPAIGGWISNRYWGERKCILYGGVFVMLGHILLGGPLYFPNLVEFLTGKDINLLLNTYIVSYQDLFLSHDSLLSKGVKPHDLPEIWVAYHLKLWSFLGGLSFIILGTALIKPAVSSIINHLYDEGAKERQTGFTIFMVSIYIGSFSANFIAGTLGEKIGWHVGFAAAAIGMFIGLVAYVLGQKKYLKTLGIEPQNTIKIKRNPLTPTEKQRIFLIIFMGLFTVIYAVAFYQKGGLLNLYTKENIDRHIFGYEIPATWFLAISTGTFILLASLVNGWVTSVFPRLNALGKLAIGLGLIGAGYLVLSVAEFGRTDMISPLWMVLTYVFFGFGDIFVWPAQIAAVAALSPKYLTSFTIGAWYLTIGLGSFFTGYVGALSESYDAFIVFCGLSIACLVAAALLALLYSKAKYYAHGVKF